MNNSVHSTRNHASSGKKSKRERARHDQRHQELKAQLDAVAAIINPMNEVQGWVVLEHNNIPSSSEPTNLLNDGHHTNAEPPLYRDVTTLSSTTGLYVLASQAEPARPSFDHFDNDPSATTSLTVNNNKYTKEAKSRNDQRRRQKCTHQHTCQRCGRRGQINATDPRRVHVDDGPYSPTAANESIDLLNTGSWDFYVPDPVDSYTWSLSS